MKTNRLILLACSVVLSAASPIVNAQSTNNRVRIEVRVQTEQDRKEVKGTTTDTVTQKKTLQIAISGKPKSPETRTGKWTVYGRDLNGRDITVLESGEFKIELPASGQQKIESKVVSATSTPAHSEKKKKVEASGTKYAGYGVVVKDGDQVVGEMFDPMGLKQEAAKESRATTAAPL